MSPSFAVHRILKTLLEEEEEGSSSLTDKVSRRRRKRLNSLHLPVRYIPHHVRGYNLSASVYLSYMLQDQIIISLQPRALLAKSAEASAGRTVVTSLVCVTLANEAWWCQEPTPNPKLYCKLTHAAVISVSNPFMLSHSKECHRFCTSNCHKVQRGGTEYGFSLA